MDTPFGAGVDPVPYMVASYAIGIFLLAGYAATIFMARSKIRRLLVAMSQDKK